MKRLIRVPFLGVNDTECVLIRWEVDAGTRVTKGTTICSVETTKSVIEIEAEVEGQFFPLASEGDELRTGDTMGLFSDSTVADVEQACRELEEAERKPGPEGPDITKKAEVLIEKHGITIEEVQVAIGSEKITEAVVRDYLDSSKNSAREGFGARRRIGIVGGATGGGALIVIDAILKSGTDNPVCVFDADSGVHGKSILGVPIVGTVVKLDEWLERSDVDAVVIAFNRDLRARREVFESLIARGVPFTNVIDRTAILRTNVEIGTGNVILGSTYLGACTLVGDNNFISSNVCLEHGNVLGSHSAFGPGVVTSGNVSIGSGVRFGTGIFIEPLVSIGDGSVIASGSIITKDVQTGAVLKHRENVVTREI